MSYVIDRRLNGKNKSTVNRQRFLRRYRDHIKKAVEEAVSRRSITDMEHGLLPVISFNAKASKEDQQKHNDFVTRMVERGYTDKQVRLLSEWYLRVRKSQ